MHIVTIIKQNGGHKFTLCAGAGSYQEEAREIYHNRKHGQDGHS